jgi:hypothetical protein
MQTYSPTASISRSAPADGRKSSRQTEDLVYQGFTVAAILLVLGSLWLF